MAKTRKLRGGWKFPWEKKQKTIFSSSNPTINSMNSHTLYCETTGEVWDGIDPPKGWCPPGIICNFGGW